MCATVKNSPKFSKILKNADILPYIDDSICGDEVTHGKPDPEIFLKACEKAGVSIKDAIVLEDSEAGIEAAYRGGLDVICIPDMKYPEHIYQVKTTAIFSSLDDVINYLKNL